MIKKHYIVINTFPRHNLLEEEIKHNSYRLGHGSREQHGLTVNVTQPDHFIHLIGKIFIQHSTMRINL